MDEDEEEEETGRTGMGLTILPMTCWWWWLWRLCGSFGLSDLVSWARTAAERVRIWFGEVECSSSKLVVSLRLIAFRFVMAEEVNDTGTRLALVVVVVVAVLLTTWELFFIFIFVLVVSFVCWFKLVRLELHF